MPGGGEIGGSQTVLYCVVPRELADQVYEPLRDHFRESAVAVVVERRRAERRRAPPRRAQAAEPARDRRLVKSASGRRVADRRALTAPTADIPPLPRKMRRYAEQLVFVERLEPASEQLRDQDSKRLVVRYQAGDRSIFSELYLRYFNDMYAYARVALADHHEAEDITQQVFMRALDALPRYELRENIPFRSWLFSIARNLVITSVKGRRGVTLEEPAHVEALREDQSAEIENLGETLNWLSDREVALFVERLPLVQRQALVLRFMFDLPSHEIARILGRSPVSIRKLQSRALKSLESRLAAVGRTTPGRGPTPIRRRLRPLPVMAERRFVFTFSHRGTGRAA